MKWSMFLHVLSAVASALASLALLGAWMAGDKMMMGFSQGHLFNDATVLFLAAISFGVGTLIHQNLEHHK